MQDYSKIITEYIKTLDYQLLLDNFPETVAYTIHIIIEEGFKTIEEIKNMDLSEYHNTFTIDIPYELFESDKIFFSDAGHYNQWSVVTTIEDHFNDTKIDYTSHNRIFDYAFVDGKICNITAMLDLYASYDNFYYNYTEIIFKIVNEAYKIYLIETKLSNFDELDEIDIDFLNQKYNIELEEMKFEKQLEEEISNMEFIDLSSNNNDE